MIEGSWRAAGSCHTAKSNQQVKQTGLHSIEHREHRALVMSADLATGRKLECERTVDEAKGQQLRTDIKQLLKLGSDRSSTRVEYRHGRGVTLPFWTTVGYLPVIGAPFSLKGASDSSHPDASRRCH
jgi:hypothetical protein